MVERIEEFEEQHLDGCARLLVATFNAEPWKDNWTYARARMALAWQMRVPGFLGLVSVADGVVGFAAGYAQPDDTRDVFYLETLCVRPDAQRTGVGTGLLGRSKGELTGRGIGMIYLLTHKGTPAEAFYRKKGYGVSQEDVMMTLDW